MKYLFVSTFFILLLLVGCAQQPLPSGNPETSAPKETTNTAAIDTTSSETQNTPVQDTSASPSTSTTPDSSTTSGTITSTTSTSTTTTTEPSGVQLQTLQSHNTKTSCWVAYKGEVYDITSYLSKHPGGSTAISRYCGTSTEFENAFGKQHGTSKVALLKTVTKHMGSLI